MSEPQPTPPDRPRTTDHGAEILGGPFDQMLEATEHQKAHGHTGIYWEGGKWYTHGPHPGGDADTKLTSYN